MLQADAYSTTLPATVDGAGTLLTHHFALTPVRSVLIDGEPWFVGNDTTRALQIADGRQALDKLDDDEKGWCSIPTPTSGLQRMRVVSEGGLYTLILRCRGATTPGTLPHRFRKWLTATVLPEIRRTGSYGAPAAASPAGMLEALRDPATVLALIAHHAQETLVARADAEAKGKALVVAHGRIAEQRPAVEAYNRLADADGTWCVTDAAKALGIRPKDLSKHLRDEGWVYTRGAGKRLLAHQHRLNDGNLVHKTTVVADADGEDQAYTQVRVTAKGLAKLAAAFAPRFPGM